jgi:hypothetical protein
MKDKERANVKFKGANDIKINNFDNPVSKIYKFDIDIDFHYHCNNDIIQCLYVKVNNSIIFVKKTY